MNQDQPLNNLTDGSGSLCAVRNPSVWHSTMQAEEISVLGREDTTGALGMLKLSGIRGREQASLRRGYNIYAAPT